MQLIPRHARQILAWNYAVGGESLGNDKLLRVVESHSGFVVTGYEAPRRLADQVTKATTMQQSEGSAETIADSFIGNLETGVEKRLMVRAECFAQRR